MFTHSKTDIESCNFVFASACLQDMAVCNFFWPVYVYRQTCSRADMGVGECVCTLADIQTSALLRILAKFNGEASFNNSLSSFITCKNTPQDAHKTLSLVQQIEQIISNDVTVICHV